MYSSKGYISAELSNVYSPANASPYSEVFLSISFMHDSAEGKAENGAKHSGDLEPRSLLSITLETV